MSPAIAFVLLEQGAKVSRSGLAEHFATWDGVDAPPEVEKEDRVLTFSHGPWLVAIALMPAPYPPDELAGPAQTSWLWPTAAEDLPRQAGHMIITVIGEGEDPIQQRKLLTMATASVLASGRGCLGVYWGDATMLIAKKSFCEMAAHFLPDAVLPLWCDFRAGPVDGDSGLTYGFSVGLEPLGHREIVTKNSTDNVGDLRIRMMDLATYLLNNGPVIEDGHTLGHDAQEKITARFGESPFGHEGEVMHLDYSSKKTKRRWFGRG